MPSSGGSSRPRDQTQVSHIAGGFYLKRLEDWHALRACVLGSTLEKL